MAKNTLTMAAAAILLLTVGACSTQQGTGSIRQATGGGSAMLPAYGPAHGVWASDYNFVAPPPN